MQTYQVTFLLIMLCILAGCGHRQEFMQSSQYYKGSFSNTETRNASNSKLQALKSLVKHKLPKWPKKVRNTSSPVLMGLSDSKNAVITFINHASFLVEIGSSKLIIDPIFSTRASPVSWAGPKRVRPPGINFHDLPNVDAVLITHNHYDHLDLPTLHALKDKCNPVIIVPLGDKQWLQKAGFKKVIAMDWWQSVALNNELDIHFVPAQHGSGRGLFDQNSSLWGGFVIAHKGINIFHAGDSGYGQHFKEIGRRFPIDLALLPIGAYKPDYFCYLHMNPKEAIRAHNDLGAKQSFPMHHKTFPLSLLQYLEAEQTLTRALAKSKLKQGKFSLLEVGETHRHPLKKVMSS